jgi:phage head maturation protease
VSDEKTNDVEDGKEVWLRHVKKITGLYDVAIVTHPAYEQTNVGLREASEAIDKAIEEQLKRECGDDEAKKKAEEEAKAEEERKAREEAAKSEAEAKAKAEEEQRQLEEQEQRFRETRAMRLRAQRKRTADEIESLNY